MADENGLSLNRPPSSDGQPRSRLLARCDSPLSPFVSMAPRPLTVVYADDDDLVRDTISRLLIEEGIEVHACEGGVEAIALCQELHPDAVLLDLNMPDPNGLDTARELRRIPVTRAMRLVALTGRGTWDLRNKATDAGFDEFLIKPISTGALVRALSQS